MKERREERERYNGGVQYYLDVLSETMVMVPAENPQLTHQSIQAHPPTGHGPLSRRVSMLVVVPANIVSNVRSLRKACFHVMLPTAGRHTLIVEIEILP